MRSMPRMRAVPIALLAHLALASCTPWSHKTPNRSASPPDSEPRVVDLDVRGRGAPVFRIPALAVTNAGTLLAAYDARPTMADVPSHIAVVMRRSTDGGTTWSDRRVIRADTAPLGFGDPSLLVDRQTGRIFLFHAASVRQGYFGSSTGNRDDDPNVLHADLSWSDDDGQQWQHRRLTAMVKDAAWGGLFASSGRGIQLEFGPYTGRLLQQFVIRRNGANYGATLYSDDHGTTWRMGALVGPGLDENKTVQLRDGTVVLNSRAKPYRLIAESRDGGVTYGAPRAETRLIDPANNGAVIRLAASRVARKRELMVFSNTADSLARRRLTLRLSCDGGRNWPAARVLVDGPAAYSTLVELRNGEIGVLFERGDYEAISFARVTPSWIGRC